MYLQAHGEFYHALDDSSASLPELKDVVVEAVGQPIRRISRFMQLALIGAGRCARGLSLPRATAVYLASSRGDLEISVDVMNHMFREGQSPKPLSFVNTVSNSSAFYVGKCLGLESRSSFVSSRCLAFENALLLALTDFRMGIVDSALIGCVESAVLPMSAHRERLEVDATSTLAESSQWFWFTRTEGQSKGALTDAINIHGGDALSAWIASFDKSAPVLSIGQYVTPDERADVRLRHGQARALDYRTGLAYHPSQSSMAIPVYLRANFSGTILHLNSGSLNRYIAFAFNKN